MLHNFPNAIFAKEVQSNTPQELAEANSRADTAELSNKTMEKKAKVARSDHDSALQKKENEVSTHKNAREKAAEDRDSARSELKAARAEAAQDKKRITQLEKQVTESAGFQEQLNRKDAATLRDLDSTGNGEALVTGRDIREIMARLRRLYVFLDHFKYKKTRGADWRLPDNLQALAKEAEDITQQLKSGPLQLGWEDSRDSERSIRVTQERISDVAKSVLYTSQSN